MNKQETLKSIGRKIALFRKLKGLNQFDLASEAGKMINTISNIERGIAMQQRARLGEVLLAQDGERLVMRLAHVQRRGKARGVRQADLTAEREYDKALNLPLIHIIDRLRDCDEKTLTLIAKQIDISLALAHSN